MNLFERMLGLVSPKAAAKRAYYRASLSAIESRQRNYDGATHGRRGSKWYPGGSDANLASWNSLPLLRERARDLVRNNALAERAVRILVANTVGIGIVLRFEHSSNKRKDKVLKDSWNEWAGTSRCDLSGRLNFDQIQALAMRHIVTDGEVLIRRVRVNDKKFPTRLQVLEADYINTFKNEELKDGGRVLQGIEVDRDSRVVAYWLFERHPGDPLRASLNSVRVDAKDIAHSFRADRAGQLRGVSWFAPVMIRLRDLDEYEDAQLVRQKIASCYTAFVHDIAEPDETPKGSTTELGEKMEPGIIEDLPPGKTVTLANPPGVTGYAEYVSALQHGIAVGIGITKAQLTDNFEQISYSSYRGSALEAWKVFDQAQYHIVIPGVCEPAYAWFRDDMELTNVIGESDVIVHDWTPPARSMLDPGKESEAAHSMLRNGVKSWSAVQREMGNDPETVAQEIASDNALFDRLKLKLDSDPRNDPGVQNVGDTNSNAKA